MEIEFSCKGCIFAFYKEDKQTSCLLGRSQLLNPSGRLDEEKDGTQSYIFNRFCNTFRPQSYLDDYYKGDLDSATNDVINEVIPRITYIIEFNYNLNSLSQIIDDITVNQSINNIGAIVVVNDKVEYNEEIMGILNNKVLNVYNKSPYLIQIIGESNTSEKFEEAFNQARNGWTLFLPQGQSIMHNFVSKIHERINYQMKRFSYSHDKETGRYISQSSLFKLLDGNRGRPFHEKVEEMQKTDEDSIVDWVKFFGE
jgi:hypothetical protein